MPARVVVVLSEPGLAESVASSIQELGHEAAPLTDSMSALHELETAARIELVVTGAEFPSGKPNGVALALMARRRRPGIKVLLVGRPELQSYIDGAGTFVPSPVTPLQLATAAVDMLDHGDRNSD